MLKNNQIPEHYRSQHQIIRLTFQTKQKNTFQPYLPLILLSLFCSLFLIHITSHVNQNSTLITVTIASTNDIHGNYYPTLIKSPRSGEYYEYGGLEIMSALIQILKSTSQQYSIPHLNQTRSRELKHKSYSTQTKPYFLYFDIGDQIQGSLQAGLNVSKGQIMADYYNHVGLNASTLGFHQMDFGQQILLNYTNKLNNLIITSNFIDNRFQPHQKQYLPLKNQKKSHIFTFPTNFSQQKQLKIGVIGIITKQASLKGFPSHYEVLDYKSIIIQQSQILKQQGVHAIILLSHAGNQCGKDKTYGFWQLKDHQNNYKKCTPNEELFKLIDDLPENTINAVLQGHRHSTSHIFYKNIPIVGSINKGFYLSALHLTFAYQNQKIVFKPNNTLIEGPIPVCQKIYQSTHTCEFIPFDYSIQKTLQNAENLLNWKFHQIKVQKDLILHEIVNKKWESTIKKYSYYNNTFVKNQFTYPLQMNYSPNSSIGDLVSTLFHSALINRGQSLDIFINFQGVYRSVWYPQQLTYGDFYSMFTFQNTISFFQISGKNLKVLVQRIQNGNKRFYPISGLCQSLDNFVTENDSSQNGLNTVKNWGQLELSQLTLPNGNPVINTEIYKVGTYKFLLQEGVDFANTSNLFSQIVHTQIDWRQLMIEQLKRREVISESILEEDKCPNGRRIMIKNRYLISQKMMNI